MPRLLPLLCAFALACGGSKPPRKLVLLHTNDEHSHLLGFGPEADDFARTYLGASPGTGSGAIKGGASRRAVVLKAERDAAKTAGADTLTVSAGDNMMGTLAQIAATTASPDFRVMKMLGYDVTTLGNHEFDYGPAGLAAAVAAAKGSAEGLPQIVSTNIHFSGTSGDAPLRALFDESGTDAALPIHRKLVVVTPNGLRVAFVGIMGADAAAVAPLKAPTTFSIAQGTTDDNRLASLAQIFTDLQPYVDSLRRDDKADLVVALSHSGADVASPDKSEDFAIARNLAGIDVIVSGHTHTEVPATLIANERNGRQVLVQQAGRYGDNVGRISLSVGEGGTVTFDTAGSGLIAVDDTEPASDASINTFVGGVIQALEQTPIAPGKPSFLGYTLAEILQAPPPPSTGTGTLYNHPIAGLDYDVDNIGRFQETELLVLAADAQLAAANEVQPTELAVEASGVIRVPKLETAKQAPFAGKLGFGDVFRAVPLGASPASGTPGYPLCRFGIWLAEVKAAFEVSAGFAYTGGHDDLFLVPAGFRFQYDTTRAPFNPSGDPFDRNNGRVTRIWQLKPAALGAGTYDGDANYDLKFDASLATPVAPGVPAGWLDNPTKIVTAASSLYIATFATFAGVHLKDADTGAPIADNDPNATIVKRGDGTEVKEWESLARYIRLQANGGNLPARYNQQDVAGKLPRRAICVGANSSSAAGGICSH
ncbi:MAG: metallophosphoesterase [Myxococcales bacterium]